MSSDKIYVIPDIHGRDFWHDIKKIEDYEKIIFLGDYVDPYPHEKIPKYKGLECLEEVINFAKERENVVLLMGNHDSTYMISNILCECRTDYQNFNRIKKLFRDNKDMFKLAYYVETERGPVVFTHAGLFMNWLKRCEISVEDNQEIVNELNNRFSELLNELCSGKDEISCFQNNSLFKALGMVSYYRGGVFSYGSCIWSDIREHECVNENEKLNVFQVVGHTRLDSNNIIKLRNIACVDSKKVWCLKNIFDAN
jgi:predicted phosphodiesterase